MNSEINSIWKNILTDIKGNINLPTYKTWFETITPRNLKKNTLTVSVSSAFAREWLESRYLSLLNNSTKKVAGDEFTIKIITLSPEHSNDGFFPEIIFSTTYYFFQYNLISPLCLSCLLKN